jgi:uncharacterized protein YjbI with pentapeptide repeats
VELTNSTIFNATFDGMTFEKEVIFWGTIFQNSSFNETTFLGLADLSKTSFGNASFIGAVFSSPVTFDGAEFRDRVSFVDSQFQKDASFNEACFLDNADFNYTGFGYYTYFSGARFSNDAQFSDVRFLGPLDFTSSNIKGIANFFESQFGAASFSNPTFQGPARFGLARFASLSSFEGAVFSKEANFVLARFSDAAYFSQAHFNDSAILGMVKFEDIASFQNVTFVRQLNLKGAHISTMPLENSRFAEDSKINLNDSDFNRLKAHWDQIKDYVIYDPGVYLALVENYRGLGWNEDEDDCYYAYRQMEQSGKEIGWSKALDVIAWLSYGYGVRPGYTVVWALLTSNLCFDLLEREWHPQICPAASRKHRDRSCAREGHLKKCAVFQHHGIPFSEPHRFFARGQEQILRHNGRNTRLASPSSILSYLRPYNDQVKQRNLLRQ